MIKLVNVSGHTFLSNKLNNHSVVVDLGANKGEFSSEIVRMWGAKVYAVEPVPELFNALPSDQKIVKFNICITRENGNIRLNLPTSRCATVYDADINEDRILIVSGMNFNDFMVQNSLSSIDLLKIDIEGAELDLFETVRPENLMKIKQIAVEFHDFIYPDMRERIEIIKRSVKKIGFYVIPFSFFTNGDILLVRQDLINIFGYAYLKFLGYYLGIIRLIRNTFVHNYRKVSRLTKRILEKLK